MNKFTPGPWTVETWGDGSSPDGYANVFSDKAEVCIADGVPIADARLIAAAPDLLEALELIATKHDYTNPENMVRIAREAIAKARGES